MKISRYQFLKSLAAGIAGIKAIASGKVEAVEKEEGEFLIGHDLKEEIEKKENPYKPCKNCGELFLLGELKCRCIVQKVKMDNWTGRFIKFPVFAEFNPSQGLYGGIIDDGFTIQKNIPHQQYFTDARLTMSWDGKGILTSWNGGTEYENFKGFLT